MMMGIPVSQSRRIRTNRLLRPTLNPYPKALVGLEYSMYMLIIAITHRRV